MSSILTDFASFIEQLFPEDEDCTPEERQRRNQAWQVLLENYMHRLLALARNMLATMPAGRGSAESAVQSALAAFLNAQEKGKVYRLDRPDDLWRLLATITANKCNDRWRAFQRRRKLLGKDAPLDEGTDAGIEPTQEDEVILADVIGCVVERFPPEEQSVVTLLLHGLRPDDILQDPNSGCTLSRASLYRLRERVQAVVLRLLQDQLPLREASA